ncbi:MAG: Gfo/Idh/MocA family oxidoreductase [Actinomycetota bacterium]
MSTPPLRWGIAGTGGIAKDMVTALRTITDTHTIETVAVGSRSSANAAAFAERHGIERAHGSYEALWADPDVDVIYVASPHSHHHPMTIAALDAGKHVVCEKAFSINAAEAREMTAAAERNDRFLMEAMWSWFMPAWHDIQRRVADGDIGDIITIDANFAIDVPDPDGRHRRIDLAGGALLDLGIYPLALARFLLGEPNRVRALANLTDQGVDATLGAVLGFERSVAVLTTSLEATSDLTATIVGTDGRIDIDAPFWFPQRYTLRRGVQRRDNNPDVEPEHHVHPNRGLAHEAEHAIERIRAGERQSDIVTWEATIAGMELMDEIRRQVGVIYPSER